MPEPPSESSGPIQSIRRSVTLPTKLNPYSQRSSTAPNPENLIFYHPSAKIVHFAPRALFPIPSSSSPSDFDYPVDTIETLPWRSATERTVATAPLRLEKGLTVFLKCGNVVHAILRNSQCWCVDGASKFVLRIRPLTYYRIEIPNETEDDKASVEDLKAALPTVLRYEVTPCPFKRAFTVELPEEAMAPRRKRAWRPKERTGSVPFIPGSNQGSPAEKSEWIDSASTGDDTDDSALTPQRTNSTTSEIFTVDEESPTSSIVFDPPSRQAPIRRSVTEAPQTFTSLLAKFDATPVPEEDSTHKTVPRKAPEATSLSKSESDVEKQSTAQPEHAFSSESQRESSSAEPISEHQEPVTTSILEPEHSIEATHLSAPSAGPIAKIVNNSASEPKVTLDPLAVSESPASSGLEVKAGPQGFSREDLTQDSLHQMATEIEETEGEVGPDHDSSLASTPESFHSAGFLSPSSPSSHTTSVECQDTLQKDLFHNSNPFMAPSAVEINALSVPGSPASGPNAPVAESIPNGFDLSAVHSKPTTSTVREDAHSPSLPIPSTSSTRSSSSVKATSPSTDFNHMSTEFRRRAQATRKRDTSPMPPPSAIYQPVPSQNATSLLSKALNLVLVPPVSLFIVLLHIAARIVISPAVNTGLGETTARSQSQSTGNDAITEDDFSFPLDREVSDYEDAETSKKLDPWDLD